MLYKSLVAASILAALAPTAVLGASAQGADSELEARSPHVGTAAHRHEFKRDVEANDDLYRRLRFMSPIHSRPGLLRPFYRTPFAQPSRLSRRDLEDDEEQIYRRLRYMMPIQSRPGIRRPTFQTPRITRASGISRRALAEDVEGEDLARRLRLIKPTNILPWFRPPRFPRPSTQAKARRALADDIVQEDLARRLWMMPTPRVPGARPFQFPRLNRPMARQARRSLEDDDLEARMISLPGQLARNRFGRPLSPIIRYRSAGDLEELD